MARLDSGEKAPNFKLTDQDEKEVNLEDFKGKKLLVYFYPKADTPGCTKQSCNVRDAREELADLGVEVVGISPDTPAKQKKFDDKHGLGFSLLSDQDNTIAKTYGDGKIVETWYKVSPKDTVAKALKTLKEA
jgi:peroxiredoxin Q/BCP